MPRWLDFDAFLADTMLAVNDEARQALVEELIEDQPVSPWINDDRATFFYTHAASLAPIENVALVLDTTINADPPFLRMERLAGTNFWHVSHVFERDDLLDYMLAVDDPMTPLRTEPNVALRVATYWDADPRNPLRMDGGETRVSVLRMGTARAYLDWMALKAVPRGKVTQHTLNSDLLGFKERALWVYTPPGYRPGARMTYPVLILHDGQWAAGPLQVPAIADALIKNNRLQPLIIAMIQSGTGGDREREYLPNDAHYQFLLTELLPFVQSNYKIDAAHVAIGGVAVGAAAAAYAALNNPMVFSGLAMISAPLGKGVGSDQLRDLVRTFETNETLPARIFQSVGRYEAKARFLRPALTLRETLVSQRNLAYRFAETGSGHGLVGFKSVIPEALAWLFPGSAAPSR
ncbi:MAG: alpha/beta hydrolase-fold protein [Chloroflexota bacterium]|nr:alpha/beta hydrolase-fold protein [Chloroflexota bacterium]